MKEKNMYNMYSGAFIFDALDRAALDYVRKEQGLDAVIVTQYANVEFQRQLCDATFRVECSNFQQVFKSFHCQATMRDKDGWPIATACFQFTTATNHCIIEPEKGEEDGNNEQVQEMRKPWQNSSRRRLLLRQML